MNRTIKKPLTLLISMLLLIDLTGCVSRGDTKNPLNPIGAKSQADKKMSTVIFYRSNDHFGLFKFNTISVYVDSNSMSFVSKDTDTNFVLEASRSEYMSNKYTPGVHTFSMKNIASQTANLKAGQTYYLAVSFHIAGIAGLQFRTKENFLESTKIAKKIKYTGGKCDAFWGCPTQVVNE